MGNGPAGHERVPRSSRPNSLRRDFAATTLIYFAGAGVARLVGLLLLPIYTRLLDPDEFGAYDFWTNLIGLVAPITFFQVWDATYRFSYRKGIDRTKVFSNGLALMAVGLVLYALLVVPALAAFQAPYLWLTGLIGLSFSLQYYFGFYARSLLRNRLYVSTGIINSLVTATISVILLTQTGLGIRALYCALALGSLTQVVVLVAVLRPHREFTRPSLDWRFQLTLIRFSAPLCLAALAYWLLSGFTRFAILNQVGLDANGLFAAASRFGVIVVTVATVINYAWNEILYRTHETPDEGRVQNRGLKASFLATLTGAAVLIVAVAFTFELIVDRQYQRAFELVPFVVLASAFNAVATFAGSMLLTDLNSRVVLRTTLLAALLNVALAWPLAHHWGAWGACLALAVASFVLMVLRLAVVRRQSGISVPWSHWLAAIGMLAASCGIYAGVGLTA